MAIAKALPSLTKYFWEYEGPTGYKSLINHYGYKADLFDHTIAAANSFEYYCEEVQEYKMPPHSYQISNAIIDYDRLVTKAARGHVKSTTLQLFTSWVTLFPQNLMWKFQNDPRKNLNILQVSFSTDQAKDWQYYYQEFVRDGIDNLKLPVSVVDKSVQRLKMNDGTITRSNGMTSSMRGGHPHFIVGDDLLSDKKYISQDLLRRIYFQGLVGMAMPGTKIAVVGTPLTYNDLLADLSEMEENEIQIKYTRENYPISKKGYVYLKFRAIDEVTGNALWPEHRPLDYLESLRREQGEIMFAREYLCEPVTDAGSMFHSELLNKCDRKNEIKGITRGGRMFGGMDLGNSENPKSSQTVFIALEELRKNVLIIRDLWIVRTKSGRKRVEKLYSWDLKYNHFKHFNVENNAFQDLLVEMLDDEVWRDNLEERWMNTGEINEPLKKLNVKGDPTLKDKQNAQHGIPSLESEFDREQILFPTGNRKSIEMSNTIKAELGTWILNPETGLYQCLAPHSDISMALYVAIKGYRKQKKKKMKYFIPEY
jgi:hypothetical protein